MEKSEVWRRLDRVKTKKIFAQAIPVKIFGNKVKKSIKIGQN